MMAKRDAVNNYKEKRKSMGKTTKLFESLRVYTRDEELGEVRAHL
jgi:hypothetical protein